MSTKMVLLVVCLALVGCEKKNPLAPEPLPPAFSDGRPSHAIIQLRALNANTVRVEVCGNVALGLVSQPTNTPSVGSNGQLQGDSLSGGTVMVDDYSFGHKRSYTVGYGTGMGTGRCAGLATTVFASVTVNGRVDFELWVKTYNQEIIQHTLNPAEVAPGTLNRDLGARRITGPMPSL